MTVAQADRLPMVPQRGLRGWAQRHPVAGFFILAYTLSWLAWLPAILLGGRQALLVPGAFGPAVAAFIVLRATGGSVGAWARQILHWRVQPRWYLYALGLPALLFAIVNGSLVLLGKPIDLSLLAERAPSYLAAFASVTLLGGGQEEPGWRGFALPRLQRRFTPLWATLLLAALWGLWHLPIYGLGLVGPMLFAVFYTYLYNRSGRRPRAGRRAASGKEQQMTTTPQTRRPQPSPGGPDRAGRPTAAAAAASPLAGQCPPG